MPGKLQPVQQRMVDVLSDGMQHTPEELHACLHDELGPLSNVRVQLSLIRRIIQPKGYDIFHRCGYYRMVRLMASPYDG